ncbi:MAG: DUF4139 domain-containing protein [Polyangiaceae bacterium]
MRRFVSRCMMMAALVVSAGAAGAGCSGEAEYGSSGPGLALSRVVLYRNGVGYFERTGRVEGDTLTIKVRKDAVNDLLKSLTVVERTGGRAVSVSMPLDPQSWANAALATLAPGRGSLAEVLDAMRGTKVTLNTASGSASGRVVMVEPIEMAEPAAQRVAPTPTPPPTPQERDHKVTLLDGATLRVVRLSEVQSLTLEDGSLAMQLQRRLDATLGEGMFQQVDVGIRLSKPDSQELQVSYVVSAPMWKPTYRIVLPASGKGKALLQGWAVVDNVSGEDWKNVALSLTSGAPIAFRYDLHTPRDVDRADLTETGVRRQARAAVGEATFADEPAPPPPSPMAQPMEPAKEEAEAMLDRDDASRATDGRRAAADKKADKNAPRRPMAVSGPRGGAGAATRATAPAAPMATAAPGGVAAGLAESAKDMPLQQQSGIDLESLQRSMQANTRASQASGLIRFDLQERVTVPEGTSTMVAILNETVDGEETFLYRPGGGGPGYEANPYRVVRFKNMTPYVLEPGPISIYAGGSFVGEGLSEAVGTKTSATIPFAVEPGILVSSTVKNDGESMRLLRIVRGVLEVESFARKTTVWTAKMQKLPDAATQVLIRHSKAGWNYVLEPRPTGTEDLAEGYLVPLSIAPRTQEGTVTVVEQTPSRTSISIWDTRALPLLEALVVSADLTPDARKKLEPIVQKRQAIGRIDTQVDGLKRQQVELDQRASETRQNLEALKRDNAAAAAALRKRLGERLEQFTKDGDKVGREVVELQTKRLELKVELDDMLQNLDLAPPAPQKPVGPPANPATPAPAAPPSPPRK